MCTRGRGRGRERTLGRFHAWCQARHGSNGATHMPSTTCFCTKHTVHRLRRFDGETQDLERSIKEDTKQRKVPAAPTARSALSRRCPRARLQEDKALFHRPERLHRLTSGVKSPTLETCTENQNSLKAWIKRPTCTKLKGFWKLWLTPAHGPGLGHTSLVCGTKYDHPLVPPPGPPGTGRSVRF